MKRYMMVLLLVFVILLVAACWIVKPNTDQMADDDQSTTSTEQNSSTPSDNTELQDTTGTTESTQGAADSTTTTTPPPTSDPANAITNPTTTPTTAPTGGNSGTGSTGTTTPPATENATPPETPPVVETTLLINTPNNTKIYIGDSLQLDYTYSGDKSKLTWTSYMPDCATVDSNGKVTAKAVGYALINVTDGKITRRINIEVLEHTLLINTPNNTEIYVGESLQLNYTYSGNKSKLIWTSYDASKVSVDNNGRVTGVAKGNAVINVTDGNITRRINIRVVEHKTEVAPELPKTTSIKTKSFNAPLYDGVVKYAGDYMTFQASPLPYESSHDLIVSTTNAGVVAVSYEKNSSDITVITLEFKSAGTATITITSADGAVSISYSVTVKSGYDFNPGSGQLTPEQWADCCTRVMLANDFNKDTTLGSYRVLTLSANELTFRKAQGVAHSLVHQWYINGNRYCWISYEGINEKGNHIFHLRWG